MIRSASREDLTGIVARGALHHEELGMPWPYDPESVAKSVVSLMDSGWLLVEDNLAGYIGYEIGGIYFNHDVKIATEHFWYVLPSDRGTGLGDELLKAAQAKAKTQGAVHFAVQLPPQSHTAIDLVEHKGFTKMHGIYGVNLHG